MPSSPPPDDATDGPVLGPDEIDIERRENVVPIDEGRYVIAADGDAAKRAAAIAGRDDDGNGDNGNDGRSANAGGEGTETSEAVLTPHTVRDWQERALHDAESHYGFRISAKAGDEVAHQQLFSDDVATVFDALLTWYAGNIDRETPVEDVLGILLAESNVRVRYPPRTISEMMAENDLSLDDSIGDLFGAITDGEGVVFPPEDDAEGFVFPSGDDSA